MPFEMFCKQKPCFLSYGPMLMKKKEKNSDKENTIRRYFGQGAVAQSAAKNIEYV